MMRLRYGENFAGSAQAIGYGESVDLGGVRVTFHPAGHVLGSAQIAVEADGLRDRRFRRLQERRPTRPARRSSWCRATSSSPRRLSRLPVFRHGDRRRRDRKAAAFGDGVSRARASGRRLFARQGAARHRAAAQGRLHAPIYLHGAMEKITAYYASRGIALGELRPVRGADQGGTRRHHRARAAVGAQAMSGRGGFPIRSPLSPPAGCGSAPARANTASHCRW